MASLPSPHNLFPRSLCISSPPSPNPAMASAPPPPPPPPGILDNAQLRTHPRRYLIQRGLFTLLGSLAFQGLYSRPSTAFSFGISGPKEWLKEQKKKAASFLLAPILASRERLQSAVTLLANSSPDNFKEARRLVKVAARDCMQPELGSIEAFQTQTGVEVCTFRLIFKNAASLLDDTDPIKLKTEASLKDLISSFERLDKQLTIDGSELVAEGFYQANDALNTFERDIRDCLGLA